MTESFLFLLGSTRPGGNTEALARLAAAGLAPEVEQKWVRLTESPLEPFRDVRHEGAGVYPEPTGNERELLDATLAATDLVIASPLYWYSVSTSVKHYLDYWTAWMRVPGADFLDRMRGKTLWAVTAHTADDPSQVEPLLGTLRLSADYLGMRWGGQLLAYGNRPGEALEGDGVRADARQLFAQRALTAG
ncbi:NAD(P)H-dependent oxidoreductase [Kribbella sp. NBC_00382]|uniref:flavodoxin family protein n=1 Tax=Kribbella sp. NBC_00382 TaxID=2975967 RepID=UPI002E20FAC8